MILLCRWKDLCLPILVPEVGYGSALKALCCELCVGCNDQYMIYFTKQSLFRKKKKVWMQSIVIIEWSVFRHLKLVSGSWVHLLSGFDALCSTVPETSREIEGGRGSLLLEELITQTIAALSSSAPYPHTLEGCWNVYYIHIPVMPYT